jgi:hypothetical protein
VSENAIIVCELATTAAEAPARAQVVTKWLLERRIIEPNPEPHEFLRPSAFRAGPRAVEAAPDLRTYSLPSNGGVDIVSTRRVHHPIGNYEPPRCPSCGAPNDAAHDLIEGWLEGEEPDVECAACAKTHLLGDWSGEFNFCVSEIAVRFNNWPPLAPRFLEELSARLGARVRVVYEHM